MPRRTRDRLLFTVPGVFLAIAAIALAKPTDSLPVGPFGFASLAVVHVLAIWPAADALAALYAPHSPARRPVAVGTLTLSVILLGATFACGNQFWFQFQGTRTTDFAFGWLARGLWTTALMLPWCFAARCLFPDDRAGESAPATRDRVITLLCAALVALAIPSGFASYLFGKQTKTLEAQLQEGRYAGALELATRLAAAGSEHPIGARRIDDGRRELARRLTEYRRELATPLPPKANTEQTIHRAALYAALGEYDAALELTEPIAAKNPSAMLLEASVLDDLGRHVDAERAFRETIAQARAQKTPGSDAILVQAYDGLAETLRDQRQFSAAEAAYLAGMRDAPTAEAHFHFQLGRHYALGGRSNAALASFQRAAALDPQQFGLDRLEVQQQMRPLHEGTPSCLLPLPPSTMPQQR